MTTSSTQTNEWRDGPSKQTQDADWVMVKRDKRLTREGFELIDAAEARCWCGGADAERCRLQGHTWPLCHVDQDKLWPDRPDEVHYRSRGQDDRTKDSNTTDDQSVAGDSEGATRKLTTQGVVSLTAPDEHGPFTKLAVLVDLLDKGRYPEA